MSPLPNLIQEVDLLQKRIRSLTANQIRGKDVLEQIRNVAASYFNEVHETLPKEDKEVNTLTTLFHEVHSLSRKSPSRQKCLDILKSTRKLLVRMEGSSLAQSAAKSAGVTTATDELIISSLEEVCMEASHCYRQALTDLSSNNRASWRGTATDLREALREVLDSLAPDKDVEGAPGFKYEQDTKRPTMRQKARFILRNREVPSGQITTSDDAIGHIENSLGGITRAVYTRSSVSTHTPTSRNEVAMLHAWVRLVLCELLALPVL